MKDLKHPIPRRKGSALLCAQYPFLLDGVLAKRLGVNQAIVLQQLHYWLGKNECNLNNIKEGRVWTYNSYDDWAKEMFFFSKEQIKRAFLSLEKNKIVISKKFNKSDWNQRKWYTIDYEALDRWVDMDDRAYLNNGSWNGASSMVDLHTAHDASADDQILITETSTENSSKTTTLLLGIDRLISELPPDLQHDDDVKYWLIQKVKTEGELYVLSNIEYTKSNATSNRKKYFKLALDNNYGQALIESCIRRIENHRNLEELESARIADEELDKAAREKAMENFNALPDSDREEIMRLARQTSLIKTEAAIQAVALDLMRERFFHEAGF